MITYVMPTRDRHAVLERTLGAIGQLPRHEAEVLIIDNASAEPIRPCEEIANGVPVRVVRSERNLCAAARNLAIQEASRASNWIVMLDDDSHPLDLRFLDALEQAQADVGAVAAEIFLPPAEGEAIRRESGGLPEVFIGCGVAIRADLFRELGGYDHTFDYYAEEYDLSARIMLAGYRISFERRFRVMHLKTSGGRDMNRIVGNLVRNNAWVAMRYAPAELRAAEIWEHVSRYAKIARKESALRGYVRGVGELGVALFDQPRREMPAEMWDRFTGLAAARSALRVAMGESRFATALIAKRGKNVGQIERAVRELGVELVTDAAEADVVIVGTLSPGPMLDGAAVAAEEFPGKRIVLPWRLGPG